MFADADGATKIAELEKLEMYAKTAGLVCGSRSIKDKSCEVKVRPKVNSSFTDFFLQETPDTAVTDELLQTVHQSIRRRIREGHSMWVQVDDEEHCSQNNPKYPNQQMDLRCGASVSC